MYFSLFAQLYGHRLESKITRKNSKTFSENHCPKTLLYSNVKAYLIFGGFTAATSREKYKTLSESSYSKTSLVYVYFSIKAYLIFRRFITTDAREKSKTVLVYTYFSVKGYLIFNQKTALPLPYTCMASDVTSQSCLI